MTFTSSTPAVCTASGSATVTIVGAGTCTVTATKAADANYNSTTSAPYNITVNKANQAALVVTGTSSPAGYGSTQTLGTTGGSGTGAVTYSTGASTACSVVGNVLTITASTGTCTVTATKAADTNYNSTTSAPVSVTAAKGVLTVTPDAQSRTFGQAVPTYTFTRHRVPLGRERRQRGGLRGPDLHQQLHRGHTGRELAAHDHVLGRRRHQLHLQHHRHGPADDQQGQPGRAVDHRHRRPERTATPSSPRARLGGSGTGAVTFTSSTPAVCTASGSATRDDTSRTGTCTVTATKAADANYNSTTSAP